jgi:hypothetical protein
MSGGKPKIALWINAVDRVADPRQQRLQAAAMKRWPTGFRSGR